MAYLTRLAGSRRPRLAAAGIALCSALAVAGCVYPPPPEAVYPPPPGAAPPPGYAPPAAPAAGYAPGAAYPAQGSAYAAPAAYGSRQAYGGPAAGIPRDAFVARWREIALRKGRDPERAAALAARRFERMDTDHDGILQPEERAAWQAARGREGASGQTWQQPPAPYR
jgi:hypothetical protein